MDKKVLSRSIAEEILKDLKFNIDLCQYRNGLWNHFTNGKFNVITSIVICPHDIYFQCRIYKNGKTPYVYKIRQMMLSMNDPSFMDKCRREILEATTGKEPNTERG